MRVVVDLTDECHHRIALRGKVVDDSVNRIDEDHRTDHGESDLPEGLPRGRAVDLAGLVDGRRYRLKTGQKDQYREKNCAGMKLKVCACVDDIDFMINVPVLKGH